MLYVGFSTDDPKEDDRTVNPQRLAIIDLDGTLLRRTSSEHSFFRFIVLRGKIRPLRLASFLLTFFRDALKLGLRQAIGWNATYLRGQTPETLATWARRYGNAYLREAVPEELQDRIRRLKAGGCLIILLSGSLQVLVEELKEKLGADIIIGRELEVVGEKLTGHRNGIYPYARQKVEALFQRVKQEEVDWKESWALADRLSDLPVLELVGHPVAVHPTAGLRRHAQQHGWEIIG
jgi:HAD superfamily hydrolase (TIGR01490 family)